MRGISLVKEKLKSRIIRTIEERLVIDPAVLPKLLAFGAGAYLINITIRDIGGGVEIVPGAEIPWWLLNFPGIPIAIEAGKRITEEKYRDLPFEVFKKKRAPLDAYNIAVSLLGSYILIEHGKEMVSLGLKAAGGLMP